MPEIDPRVIDSRSVVILTEDFNHYLFGVFEKNILSCGYDEREIFSIYEREEEKRCAIPMQRGRSFKRR